MKALRRIECEYTKFYAYKPKITCFYSYKFNNVYYGGFKCSDFKMIYNYFYYLRKNLSYAVVR